MVVFPFIILPLSVSREKSINAVDAALAENRDDHAGRAEGRAERGPAAKRTSIASARSRSIMRMLKLPDGRIRILVQGLSRARVDSLSSRPSRTSRPRSRASKRPRRPTSSASRSRRCCAASSRTSSRAVSLGKNISPEVMVIAANLDDPARLADLAASNLDLKLEEAQGILETIDPVERLRAGQRDAHARDQPC